MKKSLFCLIIMAALSLPAASPLLSGNGKGNAFAPDQTRLDTKAVLSFETAGEFPTEPQLLETASRPNGTSRVLLDGAKGTDGNCQAFGKWQGGKYFANMTLDLQSEYLITQVAVWSQESPTQGVESFDVLLSNDGQKFVQVGTKTTPEGLTMSTPKCGEMITFELEKPAVARYVKLIVRKHPGKMQMILSEIAVYGDRLPGTADRTVYLPENQRPAITASCQIIGSGAVKIDWSNFAKTNKVKGYRLYESDKPFSLISEPGVKPVREFPAKTTFTVIYPLTPGKSVSYGVTAIYEDGESPRVAAQTCNIPQVLACETFGDMLGINHFWGGGGARFTPRMAYEEEVALDLLAGTPFKEIRWWRTYPEVIAKLYDRGIGATSFANEEAVKSGDPLGIYLYGAGNEPHLHGKQPEAYVEYVKTTKAMLQKYNQANRLYAPTVCIDNRSTEWLERFYQAGAKDYFDAVDVHTYLGTSAEFVYPEGYPAGSPEGLFGRIAKVREIMAKFGDQNKPLISTEFGYTECKVANPSGNITPEIKAAYLVRGLVIHHVLNFAKVFVYSFWDEGTDLNYTEHFFGLVDYRFQKKPAYYAITEMGRQLGDKKVVGPVKGAGGADYGYVFQTLDGKQSVNIVWNGAYPVSGTFRTAAAGKVQITSMLGESESVKAKADGTFRVQYGPNPVYLSSDAPIELLKSEKMELDRDNQKITLAVPQKVVVNAENQIAFTLQNPGAKAQSVDCTLENIEGQTLQTQTVIVPPQTTQTFTFATPAPVKNSILEQYQVAVSYDGKYASFADRVTVFVRHLSKQPTFAAARMAGYDQDVYVLANDILEVTVDPARGGRILEIYDKRTGKNQLNIDYERLGGLANIAFYYCIWDQVKAPGKLAIDRNAVYRAMLQSDGIVMTGGKTDGLELVKTLKLAGNKLTLNAVIINHTQEPVTAGYYMHPEYTVGGTADSFADQLILPLENKEYTMPFWSGLGDKPTTPFTANYWILRDPAANYEIRQEYDFDRFRSPRLWFGIGCCNFEMETVAGNQIKPGGQWQGNLTWYFNTREK